MNSYFYLKIKKLIFYLIILNFNFIHFSHADNIKEFKIQGNDRVSNETIVMFSKLNLNQKINDKILNDAIKELYYTDYFETITLKNINGIILIDVKENPIIQNIEINGIDNNKILEKLKDITIKTEKYPFVENKISDQVNLLKNILKSYGYYFVKLETQIIQNKNNSVDLLYNFNLGNIAKIKKINFIGNKIYKDSTLRNVIISEETKFWKFITKNKFLDINRISLDTKRLENFYKNRGYFNIKVKSSFATITNDEQFELIFNINADEKYYFDNIKFSNKENIDLKSLDIFEKKFDKLKGKYYSFKKIKSVVDEINEFTLLNEYLFINAKLNEIVKSDNKIDIIINFDDLDKIYVDRINIYGNYITDEKVIRNTLIVDEGDPYNDILFEKSIDDIRSKNIFKSVKYVKRKNNINNIIDITVEEKATGEIFAGAGTGTTGTSFSAGIKERNYLGLGIKLDTNFTLTDDSLKGKFTVKNPNYKNSDKSLSTTIESSTNDFMSTSGYKTNRTGLSLGTEFEQFKDLYVNFKLSNYYENLETSSSASSILKKQEGDYFENLINYNITLNKLDNNFQPSSGFVTNFSQTLPIYSDDLSIENSFRTSRYVSVNENLILSAKFLFKAINSIDDNVRISKRIYLPSRNLRGFESGKIGPKDGSQYIGGNYATSLNLNSTLPNLLFENENIDFNFFIDAGNVWEVDYNSSLDSNKIRSSTGLAVNWFSAIGPLSFSYAVPLTEAKTDITEKFRFQIGTSF